jgi:hypothetical protein
MPKLENEYEDNLNDLEDLEDDGLPKRNKGKYPEIEKFKLYELTHCVAYEMAMRNNEVQKIIKEIEDLTRIQELLISGLNYEATFDITSTEYKILSLYKTLEDEYYIVYNTQDIILSTSDEQFQYVNYYEPDDKFDAFQSAILFYSNQESSNKSFKANCIVKDAYAVFQGGNVKGSEINVNKIVPNFKKPMRVFNQTQVALNLALPIEQIKDFIEIIKKEYDEENSSIQSFKELLGLKSDKDYEKIVSMRQKEWTDCFFIYDFFYASSDKNIMTKIQKLQEILTEHHGVKVLKKGNKKNEYEIVSYQTYKDMIGTSDDKDEFQIYRLANKDDQDEDRKNKYLKKEYQPYLSKKTISERLKLMKKLINNAQYKALLINKKKTPR